MSSQHWLSTDHAPCLLTGLNRSFCTLFTCVLWRSIGIWFSILLTSSLFDFLISSLGFEADPVTAVLCCASMHSSCILKTHGQRTMSHWSFGWSRDFEAAANQRACSPASGKQASCAIAPFPRPYAPFSSPLVPPPPCKTVRRLQQIRHLIGLAALCGSRRDHVLCWVLLCYFSWFVDREAEALGAERPPLSMLLVESQWMLWSSGIRLLSPILRN